VSFFPCLVGGANSYCLEKQENKHDNFMHDSAMAHIVKALVTVMDCEISSFEFLL
jgi:hypothetical protein